MRLTSKLITELQKRLKIGSRRGVHLNAIPANSRYKFDLNRLSFIDKKMPDAFVKALLSELPLKFRISWKNNVSDLNLLFEEEQIQLVRITKAFENLINQTESIESEKGINTFGFGFPILVRRDRADNKLTVAPILIWSLRIKRTKEFNTWEVLRNEDDPIYINEVLINHLQNDSNVEIEQISNEMLDDGLISPNELIDICSKLIKTINTKSSDNLEEELHKKLEKVVSIGDKNYYEKLTLSPTNSFIEFGGLFSIYEVQKQNIINDYGNILDVEGTNIELSDLEGHSFQSISSVDTDPSQQSVLHSLSSTRNVLIQGPPGTGKSQTLTAILINALENNKKTIVVCEKRTALEVLHNALVEKGLGYHCLLVRDIVKDRKIVVDSVRDRIDNSEYRRYKYNYSKDSLGIIIQKVNSLIYDINSKHKKLDEKLIGNKSWTDVVGDLLGELKGNEDDVKLSIDNHEFKYYPQELSACIELVTKGQLLYSAFSLIEFDTFFNPVKFIGDNPYLLEISISQDFDFYSQQVEKIKSLIEICRGEFISKRKNELTNQITSIGQHIDKIIKKENECVTLVSSAREKYYDFRKEEFDCQINEIQLTIDKIYSSESEFIELISSIRDTYYDFRHKELEQQNDKLAKDITQIDLILTENEDNLDLTDEIKVNSVNFRLLSLISKNKRKTISDHGKLQACFTRLQEILETSEDFEDFKFGNTLDLKLSQWKLFKNKILNIQNSFQYQIQREFDALDLVSVLEIPNVTVLKVKSLFKYIYKSEVQRITIENLESKLINSLNVINGYFKALSQYLEEFKDIRLTCNFDGSIKSNIVSFAQIIENLNLIKRCFSEKVESEFDSFNLQSVLLTGLGQEMQSVGCELQNSEKLRSILKDIQTTFEQYLTELSTMFMLLSKQLKDSKDIHLDYLFDKSFSENKDDLAKIQVTVDLIKHDFEDNVQKEFQLLDLLKMGFPQCELASHTSLIEEVKILENKIKKDGWILSGIVLTELDKFILDVEGLILNKLEYFESEKDLFITEFKWYQFYNSLSERDKVIVNALKQKKNWKKSFLIFYLNSILINSANLDLPTTDQDLNELQNTLVLVESEQLKFIKEFWFSKQIDTTRDFQQKNDNISVENLYNKRKSTRFNRLSLRQIVQYDADLFTNFFPIILTSPDVASNLFRGMNRYFDIVMFDEASQLRLEDNLPAILKGKQIIIAGDEHQMPPSNYFNKIFDGVSEDDDDLEEDNSIVVDKDNLLLSCESLLDFGTELNFQKKYLDFHYRSRHPFLIDFSNYAFYNQRLKPLPNNFEYIPIKYIQVNGTFSEHTNDAEAEMVLSIIDKNINRLPSGEYPTLGIATFNIAQRNLIKSKILERQQFLKFAEFNAKVQELEDKGMFIKNLENIQGDERDVIILSTTYGMGKEGKFSQRFGPINHSKGYKLLNVIITRAKYKIYCCTSIPEQVFMNYQEYLTVEGANNKRAVLFAYLAYCKAISESNNDLRLSVLTTLASNTTKSVSLDSFKGGELESPFEEEVYQSLSNHLGTDKLIPQLNFAGFRIDIVYDPKVVGIPKIAIECDGAKYHSSKEAYLHDLHRQKILERHGFVFHRIWSTNWWRNADRETNKLINFIRQVECTTNTNYLDHSSIGLAFTDDIETIGDHISQLSLNNREKDNEIIQTLDKIELTPQNDSTEVIQLNSQVMVKYLNNEKIMRFHIVSAESVKKEKVDGVQKISFKSPLAQSLLGQFVGNIVKIGNLDNFVEILQVEVLSQD